MERDAEISRASEQEPNNLDCHIYIGMIDTMIPTCG